MNENNEKIQTLNSVVEQLSNLGLSDNSALESLNVQHLKYLQILETIRISFENINSITKFIL